MPSKRSCLFIFLFAFIFFIKGCSHPPAENAAIDRQALADRHSPRLQALDPSSPFTVGNGQFAFTVDVTGLQSFADMYFAQGIPLETKARWAWHSQANPARYTLADAHENYSAYNHSEVAFPTDMNSDAAQWLRKNPHDLPLARISLEIDGAALEPKHISSIDQNLDLWRGVLTSQYRLKDVPVRVKTLADSDSDSLALSLNSALLGARRASIVIRFPHAYDLTVKNTPDILFNDDEAHQSILVTNEKQQLLWQRKIDDNIHFTQLNWRGSLQVEQIAPHAWRLIPNDDHIELSIHFSEKKPEENPTFEFDSLEKQTAEYWKNFWLSGAAIDFSGSTDPRALELERRIVLSQYLLAVQARADIPPQETGLTSSSWYGKYHSEMSWWHSAQWAIWQRPQSLTRLLDWYASHLDAAKAIAAQRGLNGARWPKMAGPDFRESPGGNPLIIWNQPQLIHLAELLYQQAPDEELLKHYSALVEQSAEALASMLVWEEEKQRYSLLPPIWISQEIYEPREAANPAFELAYWRYGLETAQRWRERQGLKPRDDWQARIDQLAALPQKNGRYVAIESIPDTFENFNSRHDHPSMLAVYGLLNDPRAKPTIVAATLNSVLNEWDWSQKIWGWDYPMLAMSAARLGQAELAVDVLLKDSLNNHYLNNGHCPQAGAELPVYLPANAALLSAVAMMAAGWEGAPEQTHPGFPNTANWKIKVEGLKAFN